MAGTFVVPPRLLPNQGGIVKPVGNVEIDWSHPLARGLKVFFLLDKEPLRCLVTGVTATNNGCTFNGNEIYFDGGSDYLGLPSGLHGMNGAPDAKFSMALSADIESVPGTYSAFILMNNPPIAGRFSFRHGQSGSYQPVYVELKGGATFTATAAGLFDTDSPLGKHFWGFTNDGSSTVANTRFYKDNQVGAGQSLGSVSGEVGENYLGMYASTREMHGTMSYFAFWQRELTSDEMQSFRLDPYQFLRETF